MKKRPFGYEIRLRDNTIPEFDRRIERRLSALRGQYLDEAAFAQAVLNGDPLVYEVYEIHRPQKEGELLSGLSVVHPGLVGEEFYMTKGHYHEISDTAEVYYCLKGHGLLLMENEQGDTTAEEFRPGRVVYVVPGYAHRSVNLSLEEDLVTFFVYPGNAGHAYGAIEAAGFQKLVVRRNGTYELIQNRAWARKAPGIG